MVYHLSQGNRRSFAASYYSPQSYSTMCACRGWAWPNAKKLGVRQHPAYPLFLRHCIYMIHVFLAAAFLKISSVVKCYTVLCRLSNSDGLLIMKAPYKQKRYYIHSGRNTVCIITVPLILLNTQEDVQPYYEAYSYLAKALRNDQQFQVGL